MTKKLLHSDIQTLIARLDEKGDMLDVQIDGFSIWPVIKVALWRFLTNLRVAESPEKSSSLMQTGFIWRIFTFIKIAARSAYYLVAGMLYLALLSKADLKDRPVLVYTGRTTFTQEGRKIQNYFGDMIYSVVNITDRGIFSREPALTLATAYFNACIYLRMLIKLILRRYDASFYEAIDVLQYRLRQYGHECEKLPRSMMILAAAHFCESRRVYARFFKKHRSKMVAVTDFDSVFGIVAGARSAGIPVYDMQHGTFWSGDLDHSWTGKRCLPYKSTLPFPDKLLLFGPFWKDIAKEQEYWNDDSLICVGSPVMDMSLPHRRSPASIQPGERVRVLYVSGDIMPESIANYIDESLALFDESEIELQIRLHPRENASAAWYRNLILRYKGRVEILDREHSIVTDIQNNDLVIGTATTALIECLLLGLPVMSMGAGAIPQGIAAIHNNNLLTELIPHAGTPRDFVALIRDFKINTKAWRKRLEKVESLQEHFYTRGFVENMQRLLST